MPSESRTSSVAKSSTRISTSAGLGAELLGKPLPGRRREHLEVGERRRGRALPLRRLHRGPDRLLGDDDRLLQREREAVVGRARTQERLEPRLGEHGLEPDDGGSVAAHALRPRLERDVLIHALGADVGKACAREQRRPLGEAETAAVARVAQLLVRVVVGCGRVGLLARGAGKEVGVRADVVDEREDAARLQDAPGLWTRSRRDRGSDAPRAGTSPDRSSPRERAAPPRRRAPSRRCRGRVSTASLPASASISAVMSLATTCSTCGASASAVWPAPVATSSARQWRCGATSATRRARLSPFACTVEAA